MFVLVLSRPHRLYTTTKAILRISKTAVILRNSHLICMPVGGRTGDYVCIAEPYYSSTILGTEIWQHVAAFALSTAWPVFSISDDVRSLTIHFHCTGKVIRWSATSLCSSGKSHLLWMFWLSFRARILGFIISEGYKAALESRSEGSPKLSTFNFLRLQYCSMRTCEEHFCRWLSSRLLNDSTVTSDFWGKLGNFFLWIC